MDNPEILKILLRFPKKVRIMLNLFLASIGLLFFGDMLNHILATLQLDKLLVYILISFTVLIVWFYTNLERLFIKNISRILPREYQPNWSTNMIDFLLKCGYSIILVAMGKDLLSSVLLLDLSHPVLNQELYLLSLVFTISVATLGYFLEFYFLILNKLSKLK